MTGLQGTFNTAVMAMQTQSQNLSNISTNVANVNTTAYKLQGSHFATLLNHVAPKGDRFFAVRPFDYREVSKQGIITSTGRTFDVAINGKGFFVVNSAVDGSNQYEYTRDGAFFGRSVELDVDTDNNGVNDQGTLLTTANGSFVLGWQADEDGVITETDDLSALTPMQFNTNEIFASKATTTINLQGNLSARDQGRQTVGLPFVDANGDSRTLTIGFNAQFGSNWTLDMSSVGTDLQPVPVTFDPPSISFNGLGQITSPTDGNVFAFIDDPTGLQIVSVNLNGLTQFGAGGALTVQNITQDGYIEGRLDNTYFDRNGVLIGSYTNGQVRPLYKLAIANFTNENKLEAVQGNIFRETHLSGARMLNGIGAPAGRAELIVGALEQSNVDLADQFSKMIITQRAYSSAAKVLTTADEMSQAARDLKR